MQNHLQPLIDQVTQLEVKLEPFESTRDLDNDQAHLCLKGITAEMKYVKESEMCKRLALLTMT